MMKDNRIEVTNRKSMADSDMAGCLFKCGQTPQKVEVSCFFLCVCFFHTWIWSPDVKQILVNLVGYFVS